MSKGRRRRRKVNVRTNQKRDPAGIIARVREAGAEHFGFIAIDPHSRDFCVRLTSYLGEEFWQELLVPLTREDIERVISTLQEQMNTHQLQDCLVGLEWTGSYERVVKKAFAGHWPVRMIHPFTTAHTRRAGSANAKTDEEDLSAIVESLKAGYGTAEEDMPEEYCCLRQLCRERHVLVRMMTQCKQRLLQHLRLLMPGYADQVSDFWQTWGPAMLAAKTGSAEALLKADAHELQDYLRKRGVIMQTATVVQFQQWARHAPHVCSCAIDRSSLRRNLAILRRLDEDLRQLELQLPGYLVKTPYMLLMSARGVNVLGAADFGGEAGPPAHYVNAKQLTGRAGVFPSRYQSSGTDRSNGPLVPRHHNRLKPALLQMGRNLIRNNDAYAKLARDERRTELEKHVICANKFCGPALAMMRRNEYWHHPRSVGPDSVMAKLAAFVLSRSPDESQAREILLAAAEQVPQVELVREYQALIERRYNRYLEHRRGLRRHRAAIRRLVLPEVVERLDARLRDAAGQPAIRTEADHVTDF